MEYSTIDPQNMFGAIYNFADQIIESIEIGNKVKLKSKYPNISNIVVSGMGGSAIGAEIVKILINSEIKVPFYINRNYSLPNWVNEKTLVICASYSGNTEESLSSYQDAIKKEAMICGISSGGKLSAELNATEQDLITIPGGLQPRAAVAYSIVTMLFLLYKLKIISKKSINDLSNSVISLKRKRDKYSIGDTTNPIFKLAKNIYGMIPIIYGVTDTTGAVALRWKQQLCENSKMIAFNNEIPEMNHNEIVGWGNNPDLLSELSVIWLRDKNDNERLQTRQNITETLLNEINIMQYEVSAEGESHVERMLDLIHYGDWLSYWCAILHDTDPTPVTKIDKLKEILANTE